MVIKFICVWGMNLVLQINFLSRTIRRKSGIFMAFFAKIKSMTSYC